VKLSACGEDSDVAWISAAIELMSQLSRFADPTQRIVAPCVCKRPGIRISRHSWPSPTLELTPRPRLVGAGDRRPATAMSDRPPALDPSHPANDTNGRDG
jgi:hypothetical protein